MHDLGRISEEDLSAALEYKRQRGIKLGQALVELKLATEADLAAALRTQGKVHCIHLTPGIVDPLVAGELDAERSRNLGALAINRIAGVTTVAMADPTDAFAVDELALLLKTPVLAVHAEPSLIQACIEQILVPRAQVAELSDCLGEDPGADVRLPEQVLEGAGGELEQPVLVLLRRLFDGAVVARASELHFETLPAGETRATALVVRLRVDGALVERLSLPRRFAQPIFARLKLWAGLDVAQTRLPQEGSFPIEVRGRRLDLDFASAPTSAGEDALIRFGLGAERRGLEELGLEADDLARVRRLVASGGLVAVTGPLGSGRATTLRALFEQVRASDKKLVAIEGPGADALEGATQIRVQPRLALTWARALEAALRLEPDVVLLGSLEDAASAAAAVRAALDGRLVLAGVNAQSTADAIGRWIDLGIAPQALAEALRGVISQRLVRGICPDCREEVAPRAADLERLGLRLEPGERFYAGSGCRECHGTGCRGRTGLFEVLCVEGSARELVRWGISSAELTEAVLESGLTTLADDGARKLRAGQTSIAEVLRATAGAAR